MVKNDKGRIEPVKVGTKEVTKDGFEYELTINFEFINDKHIVKASKDRTSMFANSPEFIITEETGVKIMEWCNSGVNELEEALKWINEADTIEKVTQIWNDYQHLKQNKVFVDAVSAKGNELKTDNNNGK